MPSLFSIQIEKTPTTNSNFLGLCQDPSTLEYLPKLSIFSNFNVTEGTFVSLLSENYKSNNIIFVNSDITANSLHDGKILIVTNSTDTTISLDALYAGFSTSIIRLANKVSFNNTSFVQVKNAYNGVKEIYNTYTKVSLLYIANNTCIIFGDTI